MAVCTFFGHRDCPDSLRPRLRKILVELIEQRRVDLFYVGNQGGFDQMARGVLRELSRDYPHIRYAVVLAYVPGPDVSDPGPSETMLPEGIETIHPKYAISWRNDWMLRHSNFVVAYVAHSWGGASRFARKAEQTGKPVFNLAQDVL